MLVSNRKRYLSGSDWVIHSLDHLMKSVSGAGNISQIVLMLNAPLDEHEVRTGLNDFVGRFPVLAGRVGRDILLAPYWKIPAHRVRDAALTVRQVEDTAFDGPLPSLFAPGSNTQFRGKDDHLLFSLFLGRKRSALAMTFDHRIFDARGSELFLSLFQQCRDEGAAPASGDIAFTSTPALTGWSRKFQAGRNVNRRIIALSRASTPETLPLPAKGTGGYRYHLLAFTGEETKRIYDQAYREAGYLMESPFLLAVIMQSMHDLLSIRLRPESSYLVPVTVDLRPGTDALQEVFFNYVSYLFYQVPVAAVADRPGLIALLKEQMYDQVKSGFPKDLAEASLLTRIAPLPLLGRLLQLPLKGKMATFAFSHLGKSSYRHSTFMGRSVTSLFHMPRVPAPPGIGFFSNYYNGTLNLVISHLDGLLDDRDVRMLDQGIRGRFSGGSA
jgi:hypothetical protein